MTPHTPTLYLDDAAVRRLLPLGKLLEGMRRALIDLSEGRVVQPLPEEEVAHARLAG